MTEMKKNNAEARGVQVCIKISREFWAGCLTTF